MQERNQSMIKSAFLRRTQMETQNLMGDQTGNTEKKSTTTNKNTTIEEKRRNIFG